MRTLTLSLIFSLITAGLSAQVADTLAVTYVSSLGEPEAPVDSSYLSLNIERLSIEHGEVDAHFALLDSVVPNYRFFFTAEEHWRTINTEIQYAFLRYLHDHAGVRNLILEGGFSYGFLINRYLQQGDERLLRKALTNIPVCPNNLENMFHSLRAYNLKLPEEERIAVWGIDLEHSQELSLQSLNTLLPEGTPSEKIRWHVDKIKQLHTSPEYDKGRVKQFFSKLEKQIADNPQDYLEFWGDDFDLLCLITQNATAAFHFSVFKTILNPEQWQVREEQMYGNFLALQKRFKPGNYYAQFGALHTDINRSIQWSFPTLAHRLNHFDNSPVENQVMTISRYMDGMNENYSRLGDTEAFSTAIRKIKADLRGDAVLLRLVGKDTPFPELSKTFQCILFLDEDLTEDGCN